MASLILKNGIVYDPKNAVNGEKKDIFIKDGKIVVKVWLTRINDEVLKQLKDKGLKVSFSAASGKLVIGEIAVDQLEKLSRIEHVRLVEPFTSA